ncbi:MAG: methionyl-tRNA formyltransferase [Defluviitaleaceae bacterium]|nr:methionyl-tRNA formyltransferase [Defluviitaleaceae bacterium]
MKIIFMGTPTFAAESLDAILKSSHEVVAVCTQPDRPAGRGHKLTASPVKELAAAHGLPIFQPETLRFSDENAKKVREELEEFGADIFVVAAYGLLLPKGVLTMPPLGCVNVHASLLPKYRGASPIHAAILNGDAATGITIIHMDAGLDTGDMILQKRLEIGADERFAELHDRMAVLGAEAICEALAQLENGTAARVVQDNALASHAPKLQKSDGRIDWSDSSEKIFNQVRALACFTQRDGQVIKIWDVEKSTDDSFREQFPGVSKKFSPGEIISAEKGLLVKTGDGAIRITELQAVGKKRMPASDFLRGQRVGVSDRFRWV